MKPISKGQQAALEISKAISNVGTNNLSKKNANLEIAINLNVAMEAFLDKLWESNREYINLDRKTWRVLISVPWSSKGYSEYGLTRTKADILKKIIQKREDFFLVYIEDERKYYVMSGFEKMYNMYKYLVDKPISEKEVENAKSK